MSDEGRDYVKRCSTATGSTWWLHYVFGDLANRPNDWEIWVGDSALAEDWPLSIRAIQRGRAWLVEHGFLTILDNKSGPGRRIRYRFEFLGEENNARHSGGRFVDGRATSNARQSGGNARQDDEDARQVGEALLLPTEGTERTLAPTVVDAGEFAALRQALAESCGTDLDRSTSSEAGKVARATRDILDHGGKAVDVPRAVDAYRRLMPTAMMTELALAGHWSKLTAGGASPASMTEAEKEGIRLANRGAARADARAELADRFDDDQALVDEGLEAFDHRCAPDRREGSG